MLESIHLVGMVGFFLLFRWFSNMRARVYSSVSIWVCMFGLIKYKRREIESFFLWYVESVFNTCLSMCVCLAIKVNGATLVITAAANGNHFLGSVLTLRNDNITCYEKLSVYVEKKAHTELVSPSLSECAHADLTVVFADLTECCCFCTLFPASSFRFQYLHLWMYLCVADGFFRVRSFSHYSISWIFLTYC